MIDLLRMIISVIADVITISVIVNKFRNKKK